MRVSRADKSRVTEWWFTVDHVLVGGAQRQFSGHGFTQFVDVAVEHRFLRWEVTKEGSLGDVGRFGDVLGGDAVETPLGEEASRMKHQLVPGLSLFAFAPTRLEAVSPRRIGGDRDVGHQLTVRPME